MATFNPVTSRPIVLSPSVEAQVYGLFALAMGLSVAGVLIGIQFANQLLTTGMAFLFVIVEFAIILTSRWWMERSPLNYLLFGVFPLLSGITVTPYILYVLIGYANGASILINALVATTFMAAASAVLARTLQWNLAGMGRSLMIGVIGLIALGVLQIIFPGLRTGPAELIVSGLGIVIFALFLAFDIQRIQQMARVGANPFLMALSLYLDIFNLFLYVLRFMLALSGNRRR
ncbi:Bax inhibitor-1 family protein [Candidatus Peregrinibacteria bacterium]|nr:Bax inhibitor-1 family protein [Candidatus Peregrinibacteria bacterium]MBI3816108.1 Bax inhibitor-1 family protein [Candidatus Peregrinibacteria bacterium]